MSVRNPFLDQVRDDLKNELPRLQPCPFCGHEWPEIEGHTRISIVCSKCKAEGPESPAGENPYDAVRIAVQLWNNRMGQE